MRFALAFAAASGFLAVALGAWAAHGLEARLGPQGLAWVRTGLDYQGWHAAALLAVAALAERRPGRLPGRLPVWAALAFAAGTVLFSGSLYLLAFTGMRGFAHATPFGGLAFLAGWGLLLAHALGRPRADA